MKFEPIQHLQQFRVSAILPYYHRRGGCAVNYMKPLAHAV